MAQAQTAPPASNPKILLAIMRILGLFASMLVAFIGVMRLISLNGVFDVAFGFYLAYVLPSDEASMLSN
jgi:hypothetical protein